MAIYGSGIAPLTDAEEKWGRFIKDLRAVGDIPGTDVPGSSWYVPEELAPFYGRGTGRGVEELFEELVKNIRNAVGGALALSGEWASVPELEGVRRGFLPLGKNFSVPGNYEQVYREQVVVTVHQDRLEAARRKLAKQESDARAKAEITCFVCGGLGRRHVVLGLPEIPGHSRVSKDSLNTNGGMPVVSVVACRPCLMFLELEATRRYGAETLDSGATRAETIAGLFDN